MTAPRLCGGAPHGQLAPSVDYNRPVHRLACILLVALLSCPAVSGLVHALHCHGHAVCHGHHTDGDSHVARSTRDAHWGRPSARDVESCPATTCGGEDCAHGLDDSNRAIGAVHHPASCCGHHAHWPLFGIVGTPPRGEDDLKVPTASRIVTIWSARHSAEGSARGWAMQPALHDPGGGRLLATLRTTRLIV